MRQIKSYNIFNNFLKLNIINLNKTVSVYLIPLSIAQTEFNLCIDCGEEFTDQDLQPLFDNFGDVDIDLELLQQLIQTNIFEPYKFSEEEMYEFLREFNDEEN